MQSVLHRLYTLPPPTYQLPSGFLLQVKSWVAHDLHLRNILPTQRSPSDDLFFPATTDAPRAPEVCVSSRNALQRRCSYVRSFQSTTSSCLFCSALCVETYKTSAPLILLPVNPR